MQDLAKVRVASGKGFGKVLANAGNRKLILAALGQLVQTITNAHNWI